MSCSNFGHFQVFEYSQSFWHRADAFRLLHAQYVALHLRTEQMWEQAHPIPSQLAIAEDSILQYMIKLQAQQHEHQLDGLPIDSLVLFLATDALRGTLGSPTHTQPKRLLYEAFIDSLIQRLIALGIQVITSDHLLLPTVQEQPSDSNANLERKEVEMAICMRADLFVHMCVAHSRFTRGINFGRGKYPPNRYYYDHRGRQLTQECIETP